VLALRDLAFEAGIANRVVLDLDRHALDTRVVARALRHGPALERVADLQAKVVVAPTGMVELDHEDRPAAPRRRLAGLRLARPAEVSLAAVVGARHRAGPGSGSPLARCR